MSRDEFEETAKDILLTLLRANPFTNLTSDEIATFPEFAVALTASLDEELGKVRQPGDQDG